MGAAGSRRSTEIEEVMTKVEEGTFFVVDRSLDLNVHSVIRVSSEAEPGSAEFKGIGDAISPEHSQSCT